MGRIKKDEDILSKIAEMIEQARKQVASTIDEQMLILHSLRGEFR